MARVEYKLFRVSLIFPQQPTLFDSMDPIDRPNLLTNAILSRPELDKWHIGNVELYSANSGYFAVGRLSKSTIDQYDEETKNFKGEELDVSPYTHCVFDAAMGLLGIAQKNQLSQSVEGISRNLQKLLSSDNQILQRNVRVEISPIQDPGRFLRDLESADRILQYTATFRGPNPFDADAHFQKPMSVYTSYVNGIEGSTTVKGEELSFEPLREVTKSTSATGNTASAKIRRRSNSRPEFIRLGGNIVGRSYDEINHDPRVSLDDLREGYHNARD